MSKKPNTKLIVGGVIIAAALIYLLVSSTIAGTQYFMTVEEVKAQSAEVVGKPVRLSGAVLGESIAYDVKSFDLSFDIAQIPGDHRLIDEMGGMQVVLEAAAADPSAPHLTVHYNGPRPDLLQHAAQAIITGELDENGVFQASELLLKCPSKYEAAAPAQGK